jgi:hypothetical protein
VRNECWAAVILVLSAACNSPEVQLRKIVRPPPPGGPQVQATVVTIRTTEQPENKTTTSTIVIGSDFARAAEEVGMWRLFDFREQRVAFVDDVDKTYRYESLKTLQKRHADAAQQPMIDGIPRAEFLSTGATRSILGVPATQTLVKLGAYQRELWFGEHPLIPTELFSLMQASEFPGHAAPMVRKSNEALMSVRGFPLVDHSEVPFGKTKIVVDRTVVSVGKRNVPESLLVIPEMYRDISVKAPAERPPDVASPPPGQKTPAEGSQSSSTTQTDP